MLQLRCWHAAVGVPCLLAGLALVVLFTGHLIGEPEPLESFVFLEQHDSVLRETFRGQAHCLRRKCRPFLADCSRREECLDVLDHVLGDRCRPKDEVCSHMNLTACPTSFNNLWGCWSAFCKVSGFEDSGADKIAAAFASADVPRIFKVKDAVVKDDGAKGLEATHERNFGESEGGEEGENFDSHGHTTTYLHTKMAEVMPGLLERVNELAREADKRRSWGIFKRLEAAGKPAPGVRCVELIEYNGGDSKSEPEDADSIGWHQDTGSLLTAAVMLSEPADYDGGAFQLRPSREDCSPELTQTLAQGDILFWESWRPHRVTPVTRGRRVVLVVELWEFANTTDAVARRPDVPSDYHEAGVVLWSDRYGWSWGQLMGGDDEV